MKVHLETAPIAANGCDGAGLIHEDGSVRAIYPDNGNGDRPADAEASPDVRPGVERDTDVTLTLEVDGEMFSLR